MDRLLELDGKEITIGYHEGDRTRFQSANGRVKKGGESMAEIAAQNEFGTDRIPERSFIRSGWDMNISTIERVVDNQVGAVADGTQTVPLALSTIAQVVKSIIQLRIDQIYSPPNSPVTIALKGSSKPLIDTGQMRAAVSVIFN